MNTTCRPVILCVVIVTSVLAGTSISNAAPKKKSTSTSSGVLPMNEATLKRVLKGIWQNPPQAQSGMEPTAPVLSFDGELNLVMRGVAVRSGSVLVFPGTQGPVRVHVDAVTGLDKPARGIILELPFQSATTQLNQRWLLLSVAEKKIRYRMLDGAKNPESSLTKISDRVWETKPTEPKSEASPAPVTPPAMKQGSVFERLKAEQAKKATDEAAAAKAGGNAKGAQEKSP